MQGIGRGESNNKEEIKMVLNFTFSNTLEVNYFLNGKKTLTLNVINGKVQRETRKK